MREEEVLEKIRDLLMEGSLFKVSKVVLNLMGIEKSSSIIVDCTLPTPKVYYFGKLLGRSKFSKVKELIDKENNKFALKITVDDYELSSNHRTCLEAIGGYFGSFSRVVEKTLGDQSSNEQVKIKKNYILQKLEAGNNLYLYYINRFTNDTLVNYKYLIALNSLLEMRKLNKLWAMMTNKMMTDGLTEENTHPGAIRAYKELGIWDTRKGTVPVTYPGS